MRRRFWSKIASSRIRQGVGRSSLERPFGKPAGDASASVERRPATKAPAAVAFKNERRVFMDGRPPARQVHYRPMYLVDGNNVMAQRVGWHRNKRAAAERLVRELARLAGAEGRRVVVVYDGPAPAHAAVDPPGVDTHCAGA